MGVGTVLFGVTRQAALEAGIAHIDAAIGDKNERGLSYYEARGFQTYAGTRLLPVLWKSWYRRLFFSSCAVGAKSMIPVSLC